MKRFRTPNVEGFRKSFESKSFERMKRSRERARPELCGSRVLQSGNTIVA